MPTAEALLIARATYDIDFESVVAAGVTEDMFTEEQPRRIYGRARQFLQEYGRSPSAVVIRNEFPSFKLKTPDEPLDYWISQVKQRYEIRLHQEGGDRWATAIGQHDPVAAREALAETLRMTSSLNDQAKEANVADLFTRFESIWMARADAKDGLIGIPTGFPTINRATLGFQPTQLVTIAGLAGAGKSTLGLLMAREAQKNGYVPYFMSFEMSDEEQFGRYVAMEIGVPYNRLISWRLKDDEKERYFAAKKVIEERSIFTLCTDITRGATISGLESALLRRDRPDVVFIDGVYLMHDEVTKMPGTDWQAMTNITRGLKQLAQRREIPIIMTTQALMSKTSKGSRKGHRKLDMYSPGYSSSFAQDSDVMFALEKDEQREKTERILRVVKARHCAAHTVVIEWNWARGAFGDEQDVLESDDDEETYEDDDDQP
jgi:replicative DNA helicase